MAPLNEAEVAFVKAPSGLAGFLLVTRLPGSRRQNTQDVDGQWIVRVPLMDTSALRALIKRVQAWMRQEQIASTTVSVGADVYRVGFDHVDLETRPKRANELEEKPTGVREDAPRASGVQATRGRATA
ncbi:MAG TPA: hypothetical protein VFA66_10400 [Gaiellaceae bacterium]|nr:hypothetical protein [Gaiellaceae bacterium]